MQITQILAIARTAMTIRKIAALASAALLVSGVWVVAQAQPERQSVAHGHGVAGVPSQPERRAPPARPNDYPGSYRLPVAAAPLRYRQPVTIITPSILAGSVLPYGYGGYYPINDWGDYNLSAPCCGQYWVQYGQSFLLVSPNGVVLQVFTP